tara:strand:+ start:53 stop:1315 length:1263 start_codon:yes stop_codon:yes gene_type:complete
MDGVEISGFGNNSTRVFRVVSQGGGGELFSAYNDKIDFKKLLCMNEKRIDFYNGGNQYFIKTDRDNNNFRLDIRGYNGISLGTTNGGITERMRISTDRIDMYRKLYMNSAGASGSSTDRPLYLHTDQNFYIKYLSNTTINGTDIAGFSGVRLSNTDTISSNSIQLQTFSVSPRTLDAKGSVEVYNKLSVIKNGATLQQDANDIFTVRNTGFCKAIIHSDNSESELAFKTGGLSGPQAVIKRQTNNRFFIDNNGEFRVQVQNNTCNFVNNNGTLAWQSDRNLVIYDSGGSAIFASNTSTSERRFKDNIVSLDLENSYNIIKLLNPVSFVYKEDPNIPKKGFIIDEIEDKIPECIKEITNCDCENMSSKLLYKEDIMPDLVASVKYLISKVETQESTISTLTQQLTTQSTLISNLQSQLDSN